MIDMEIQDVVPRIRRAQADTDKYLDAGRKLRADAGKFERDNTALAMTAGAELFATGAVIGGLLLRLMTGH